MIAVLEEDWGLGGDGTPYDDYYPPKDKYGWRNFDEKPAGLLPSDIADAYNGGKRRKEEAEKKEQSLWDKFWNRGDK
jgi:hypothetical protein